MNLHGSLLPAFRGRCPVNWVLIKGEKRTGVTLHIMEAKPDAGEIVAQTGGGDRFRGHGPHPRATSWHRRPASLMRGIMPRLESGTFGRMPQTGATSYYGGRRPEDGVIDWTGSCREHLQSCEGSHPPLPRRVHHARRKKTLHLESPAAGGEAERSRRIA